jgi:glycosidase
MNIKKILFLVSIAIWDIAGAQNKVNQFIANSIPTFNSNLTTTIPKAPKWVERAAFYEIYPQTFKDSNGDGIGDLKGIISELDYVKSLGVDAIWLNPFYVSPFRDAGYDVSDYYHVAPRYGTDQDAKDLFRIANEKGLKVIVDFVPGHTSIDHPWFKASCSPQKNRYSNWYVWTNGTWFTEDYKYRENFIQGYCERDGNFMTNFFWHQPALNYGYGTIDPKQPWQLTVDHPDVMALREEMKNIMKHWLEMGCNGFRVDMAGSLVKNDNERKIAYFWKDVRAMMDEKYPDAFLISEWSYPIAAIQSGFHADFMHWFDSYNDLFAGENSFFRAKGNGNICKFLSSFLQQYNTTKETGYISLPVGNHDLIRINNGERDQKDIEIIQVFAFTMPNIPFIYYGDEIGMRQLDLKTGKEGAYGTRAGARTPMQWNNSQNLGFSTAEKEALYFPVDNSLNAPTVQLQANDKASLLNFTKKLVSLHKNEAALENYSTFTPIYAQPNQYPFIYLRENGKERILVVLNPSDKEAKAEMKSEKKLKPKKILMGVNPIWTQKEDELCITISPKSYSIIKL